MTIYLDSDFLCHTAPGDGLAAIETDALDGRCAAYIEGMRYVPEGEIWTREDGVEFSGEMVSPWRNSAELERVQAEYDRQLLAEYRQAYEIVTEGE
jgi:hypothetical protein